jgi:hypothetical protein
MRQVRGVKGADGLVIGTPDATGLSRSYPQTRLNRSAVFVIFLKKPLAPEVECQLYHRLLRETPASVRVDLSARTERFFD